MAKGERVRLLEAGRRPPLTPVERLAVSALRREGALPLTLLAERVARDLYVEGLRHGGWVLDIGVFGQDVFVPDVIRELEAADGILWEIEALEGVR